MPAKRIKTIRQAQGHSKLTKGKSKPPREGANKHNGRTNSIDNNPRHHNTKRTGKQ